MHRHFPALIATLALAAEASHPLLELLQTSCLDSACLGAVLRRALALGGGEAGPTPKAVAPGTSTSAAAAAAATVSALRGLLRAQLLGTGVGHAGGTERLVRVAALHSRHEPNCDQLTRGLGLAPRDLARLVPELQRATCVPHLAHASFALLASLARCSPAAVCRLAPLCWMEEHAEAALDAAPASATVIGMVGPQFGPRLASLLSLMAAALAHRGGTQRNFHLLVSRGVEIAVCGGLQPLIDCLCAYPLPLCQLALPTLLTGLQQRCVPTQDAPPPPPPHLSARDASTALLVRAIGCAAHRLTQRREEEIRAQVSARRRAIGSAAGEGGHAHAAPADEYDYMLHDEAAQADEREVAATLLLQLHEDPIFGCLPLVMGCAKDGKIGAEARAAAVGAMGRFAHAHEALTASLLPELLALAARGVPTPVRRAATLVFASLVATYPAHAEVHSHQLLHDALQPSEPRAVRLAALGCLTELLAARRLKASAHLSHILPLLLDDALALSGPATACVRRLAELEGPQRWPRLLHTCALANCPTMAPPAYAKLLPHLLPSSLTGARATDLAALGSSVATQLGEAAALHAAGGSGGGGGVRLRRNLAQLLGVWPPSDKSLAVLLRLLGGSPDQRPGGVELSGTAPLLALLRADQVVRGGLRAHASRGRTKCKGATLTAVTDLLRSAGDAEGGGGGGRGGGGGGYSDSELDEDEDEDAAPAGPPRRTAAGKRKARGTSHLRDEESEALPFAQPAEAERAARAALDKLRSSQKLYMPAHLPPLPKGTH